MKVPIDKGDWFIAAGLSCLGAGFFLLYGAGVSLAVVGALLFCMGFFAGAVRIKK